MSDNQNEDWFEELCPDQQQDICESILDADKEETIPHWEVAKMFEKWGLE